MGKRPWLDTVLLVAGSFLLLDLLAHWHPYLRETWEFLPHGDTNEFVTIWVARFAYFARTHPFAETFWLVNVRSPGDIYSSHPGGLTFLTSTWESLFGDAPSALRRLAILFFSLRIGLLFELVRKWQTRETAFLAVLLYIAIPATQTYDHALSFEVIGGTFVLAAFWALPSSWMAAFFFACAVATDWPTLLAFPVLLLATPRKWVIAAGASAAFLGTYACNFHFGGSDAGTQMSRLGMFLVGPFFVLPGNSSAQHILLERVLESFPFFLSIPFAFDLHAHGWRGRPYWWYCALIAGGLYVLCFLGVFRAHAYLAQLVVIAMAASAARIWLEWRQKKVLFFALVCIGGGSIPLLRFEYPFKTLWHAETQKAFAEEAKKAVALVGNQSYRLVENETQLRPKPLEIYWPQARMEWGTCTERHARLKQEISPEKGCTPAGFDGAFLALDNCPCSAP